jgi:ABC-type sugar transport system permease subunit
MTAIPVALANRRTRPLISWRVRQLMVGYSYLLPAALCMLATVVVPIGMAMKMSLYNDVLYKPQAGLIWEWLYQPNYGVINDLLIKAGWLHDRIAWLSSPDLAMAISSLPMPRRSSSLCNAPGCLPSTRRAR